MSECLAVAMVCGAVEGMKKSAAYSSFWSDDDLRVMAKAALAQALDDAFLLEGRASRSQLAEKIRQVPDKKWP